MAPVIPLLLIGTTCGGLKSVARKSALRVPFASVMVESVAVPVPMAAGGYPCQDTASSGPLTVRFFALAFLPE